MFPAVGQGALGIECRSDDQDMLLAVAEISDKVAYSAVSAERQLLAALRAGCQAPLGVVTNCKEDQLTLEAVVLSPNGGERLYALSTGNIDGPERLGHEVADDLIQQGAERLIDESRG